MNFLLGPYSSSDVLAASSAAETVSGGRWSRAAAPRAGSSARGYRYVFGTLPPADEYYRSTIDMLQQLTPKPKTVALIIGDDPFDIALEQGTRALLREAGMELVLQQQYSERTPNFYNILTLLEARSPDVLLWSGHEAGRHRASSARPRAATSIRTCCRPSRWR